MSWQESSKPGQEQAQAAEVVKGTAEESTPKKKEVGVVSGVAHTQLVTVVIIVVVTPVWVKQSVMLEVDTVTAVMTELQT